MRTAWVFAAALLVVSPVSAQNFGNIKPNTVLGNPDPTATRPAVPTPLAIPISPRSFGGVGDGTADDTAAMNSAITAAATTGKPLVLDGLYRVVSGLSDSGATLHITGPGVTGLYPPFTCAAGLRQGTANITVLTLTGKGSSFTGCIDQASGVTNTTASSIGIKIGANAHSASVRGSQINLACNGIEVTGNGTTQVTMAAIENNIIIPANTAGCYGLVIGRSSTGGNTIDTLVMGNNINCGFNTNASGVLLLDSGGMFFDKNDPYGCQVGMRIAPGTNQAVDWSYFSGVLGDSSEVNDLQIDTSAASALVRGGMFTGSWSSNAKQQSVKVQNTGGGSVNNLNFNGHSVMMNGTATAAMNFQGGTDISVRDSYICTGGGPAATGIIFGGNISQVRLQNNRIGNCLTPYGALAVGLAVSTSSNFVGTIIGNDFAGSTTAISWNPTASGEITAMVKDNLGVDNLAGGGAAATTINIGINPRVFISGTTTIATINPTWSDRQVQFVFANALTLGTGGNICGTPRSIAANNSIAGFYSGGSHCWVMGN